MLTDADRRELAALITEPVAAATKPSPCTCNLSSGAQQEMSHFMGMLMAIFGVIIAANDVIAPYVGLILGPGYRDTD